MRLQDDDTTMASQYGLQCSLQHCDTIKYKIIKEAQLVKYQLGSFVYTQSIFAIGSDALPN